MVLAKDKVTQCVCVCDLDVGGVQVGADIETRSEGETFDDAALHSQAAQDADEVPRSTVAQEQHENHVGNLSESPTSAHRRLGIRQRSVAFQLLLLLLSSRDVCSATKQ